MDINKISITKYEPQQPYKYVHTFPILYSNKPLIVVTDDININDIKLNYIGVNQDDHRCNVYSSVKCTGVLLDICNTIDNNNEILHDKANALLPSKKSFLRYKPLIENGFCEFKVLYDGKVITELFENGTKIDVQSIDHFYNTIKKYTTLQFEVHLKYYFRTDIAKFVQIRVNKIYLKKS